MNALKSTLVKGMLTSLTALALLGSQARAEKGVPTRDTSGSSGNRPSQRCTGYVPPNSSTRPAQRFTCYLPSASSPGGFMPQQVRPPRLVIYGTYFDWYGAAMVAGDLARSGYRVADIQVRVIYYSTPKFVYDVLIYQ